MRINLGGLTLVLFHADPPDLSSVPHPRFSHSHVGSETTDRRPERPTTKAATPWHLRRLETLRKH